MEDENAVKSQASGEDGAIEKAVLEQIAEHYSFTRQHINLMCGAFLTFCALNATFAKISIEVTDQQEKVYGISKIICLSFAVGNLAAMAVFQGAAVQLNASFHSVAALLALLRARKVIKIDKQRKQPLLWHSGYAALLRTVLRGVDRPVAVKVDPLNAIPVDDYCAVFGIFAVVCLIASAIWFIQCVLLLW